MEDYEQENEQKNVANKEITESKERRIKEGRNILRTARKGKVEGGARIKIGGRNKKNV
jgi:predicted RNA-binding protein with PUA domain